MAVYSRSSTRDNRLNLTVEQQAAHQRFEIVEVRGVRVVRRVEGEAEVEGEVKVKVEGRRSLVHRGVENLENLENGVLWAHWSIGASKEERQDARAEQGRSEVRGGKARATSCFIQPPA